MNKDNKFSAELLKIADDRINGSTTMLFNLFDIMEVMIKNHQNLTEYQQELNEIIKSQSHFINLVNITRQISENLSDTVAIINLITDVRQYYQKLYEKQANIILQKTHNDKIKILTHSNSSSIKNVVLHLKDKLSSIEIVQTVSTPGDEGKLQADFFCKNGLPVTLIDDSAVANYIPEVDFILSGCDQYNNTHFVNKTGTLNIAIIAKHYDIRLYVLCDKYKQTTNLSEKITSKAQCPKTISYILEKIRLEYATEIID